ncbi:hypothetical protein L1987_57029 [Smallanthus sonchifolius]|uniref:Uncharacterized protein n=1 Tax=Smallanthus sonchifolius TaxID=185202 RepID=A0ACB9DBQ5_9ASTR|nr:hypothetical protein L1987_57029 [Smallanthus sonchifolius]
MIICHKTLMETSQPLTIESFSYSWLINQKPSLDRIFDHNEFNKQENNTNSIVNSQRVFEETQNFCFNLPYATNLVDADEIFCNGRIIPKSVNQIKVYSCPATPIVHFPHNKPSKYTKKYSQLIADWRVSSKKVFRKCLSFLVPRKSTRIVDTSRNSTCLSPSMITNEQTNTRIEVYRTTFWRTKGCDHNSISGSHFSYMKNNSYCDYNERSVREAIAHCKKSSEE